MHRQRPSERPLIGARTVLEPILYKRDSFFLAKPKRFDSVHSHATTMEFLFKPLLQHLVHYMPFELHLLAV